MTLYVDQPDAEGWCHLISDDPGSGELEQFAERLGLKPDWAQLSNSGIAHFDLRPTKRRLALELGAQLVTRRHLVELAQDARYEGPQP